MKKVFGVLLAAVTLSVLTGNRVLAQTRDHSPGMKIMTFEQAKVHIFNELGAIIVSQDSSLMVQMIMPVEDRAAEYQSVDLQAQDRIFMLNGKKIVTIQDLDDSYQKIDVGKDVQLAIKRGKDMMIVSFPKADPENKSGSQTMIIRKNVDLSADQHPQIEADPDMIAPVPDAGIVLITQNDKAKVMTLLPNASEILKNNAVQEGDFIVSLQGKKISSAKQFSELFEGIAYDSPVKMKIERDGKETEISFKKQKSNMNFSIQR